MKTIRSTIVAVLLAGAPSLFLAPSFLHAQGSLTPPGAPAPLFKTLDQVKPGTAITNVPFTITSSGYFYLTRSFSNSSTAIFIGSDDVSLDLGGFTLTGDGGVNDHGVRVGLTGNDGQSRVTIRNGTVRNFGSGVFIGQLSSSVQLEDVRAYGCAAGFQLASTAASGPRLCTVRHCYAVSNTSAGILIGGPVAGLSAENLIVDCVAQGNQTGIQIASTNNLVIRNLSFGNAGGDYSISPNNRSGAIIAPAVNTVTSTISSPGSGTTDPFANLRY